MSLKDNIRKMLQSEFDIPFEVGELSNAGEPNFIVAPYGNNNRLFDITVRFPNKIRMEMIFEPQKYGAQMVREMGTANTAHKDIFCAYARQLSNGGSRISLRINDTPHNPVQYEHWPKDWNKVYIKVDIRPVDFDADDRPDYFMTISKWLPVMTGLSLSLLNVVKIDDIDEETGKEEGRKYDVVTNRYERNPINRILCIAHYGYTCQICGFDFEKKYGAIGKHFIHVHHIVPVSQMGEGYHVDPVRDLIPVCPNCHAMLHKENPPIAPDVLRQKILANTVEDLEI